MVSGYIKQNVLKLFVTNTHLSTFNN